MLSFESRYVESGPGSLENSDPDTNPKFKKNIFNKITCEIKKKLFIFSWASTGISVWGNTQLFQIRIFLFFTVCWLFVFSTFVTHRSHDVLTDKQCSGAVTFWIRTVNYASGSRSVSCSFVRGPKTSQHCRQETYYSIFVTGILNWDRFFALFALILICHVLERSGSSHTSWRAPTASGLWDTRMWTVIPSTIPMSGDKTPLQYSKTQKFRYFKIWSGLQCTSVQNPGLPVIFSILHTCNITYR